MSIDPSRLREHRQAAGLSREQLAILVDKTAGTICAYETGGSQPASTTFDR